MPPSVRTPITSGVTAGFPQAAPGAHPRARRYLTNTVAAPIRQMTAAPTNAIRCGAAKIATPASQALLRPKLPSIIGIAQHDAAPNAAASPPIARRSAPVSLVVSRTRDTSRISSVILAYPLASYHRCPDICACRQENEHHDAARTARPQTLRRHRSNAIHVAKFLTGEIEEDMGGSGKDKAPQSLGQRGAARRECRCAGRCG